jgi:hypothetical protein
MGITADSENFLLESIWLCWKSDNLHRDFSVCRGCGVETHAQHLLDCPHGTPMLFSDVETQQAAPIELDGTCRLLLAHGLPITREDYLRWEFLGNPPAEPLDGELEAELPDGIRKDENTDNDETTCDAPSAGPCGEPSHTSYTQAETDAEED